MKLNVLATTERALRLLRYLALPDLCNSTGVAKLRYIQSIYETPESRNPDTLVGDFLSPPIRWLSLLQGRIQLAKLRLNPFYYYIIARTRHYDRVFVDAMRGNAACIFNIGCGTDTRAYRLAAESMRKNITECDQANLIFVKQKLVKKRWPDSQVQYMSIDLNDGYWPELEARLADIHGPVLVMLEGVSTYIREDSFRRFLSLIAAKTRPGSRLAYDYKLANDVDNSGQLEPPKRAFRLPEAKAKVAEYHEALGYVVDRVELGAELTLRLLPALQPRSANLFREDGILELTVAQR